jgi:hypothetical protein
LLTGVSLMEADYAATAHGAVHTDASQPEDGPDAARRALERRLVEESGILMSEWAVEVSTEIGYAYDNSSGVPLVPRIGVADRDVCRDTIENTFTLRVRWPWAEQTDLRVGCNISHEEVFTADLNDSRSNSSGLSDTKIGLTKQLPREIHSLPTCWVRCIEDRHRRERVRDRRRRWFAVLAI